VSAATKTSDDRFLRGERLIEVIAVILLAIATLGSAWCAYQASKWNSDETQLGRQATDARVEASREFSLATQKVAYDSTIVAQYAQAYAAGNQQLMDFYRNTLIRPDFLPVIERWQAEAAAGGSPANLIEDTEYVDEQFAAYRELDAQANADNVASDEAGQEADDYVLTALMLASALFFAGVTTSFRVRLPRLVLLLAAGLMIAYAASRVSTLHVA
jgi:hypothetical protein